MDIKKVNDLHSLFNIYFKMNSLISVHPEEEILEFYVYSMLCLELAINDISKNMDFSTYELSDIKLHYKKIMSELEGISK